jgi:hypothetical protein
VEVYLGPSTVFPGEPDRGECCPLCRAVADWWIATGRARLNEHGLLYWVLAVLFHVPLYLLLFLRCWQLWRGKASSTVGFLVLMYMAYWSQYSLIYGDPRFGIPVYPVLVGAALLSTRSTAR